MIAYIVLVLLFVLLLILSKKADINTSNRCENCNTCSKKGKCE